MQTFLMWRCGDDADPGEAEVRRVVDWLERYCRGLFAESPQATTLRQAGYAIVYIELPVKGWIPKYHQQDETTWAFSLDYPVDADVVLERSGEAMADRSSCLPQLGRALNTDAASILEELSPPFTLIWGGKDGREIFVQNDGLGFSQILEYSAGARWALTNRPYALKALGIKLVPSQVEWATRAVLGWFPKEQTGFRGLSYLWPGTTLRLDESGVERTRHDVIRRWLAREEMAIDDCLEMAATSVRRFLESASRHWSKATAGLTGGMPSWRRFSPPAYPSRGCGRTTPRAVRK
ncbi:MAG: hypothetical protein V2A76_04295 [Planctomycetota bacterium]